MKEVVKLTGMRELEQTMKALPQEIKRRPIGLRALRAGGEPLAKVARGLAPVDEGALRESIDALATLASSQRADKGAVAPLELYVGPGQHPQAITQEFGTYKEPPQPFMRPAWDIMKVRVLDLIGAQLGIEVDKAARRYAKKIAKGS